MIKINFLKEIIIISTIISTITCATIQKTKIFFKNSKYIQAFSLTLNIIIGILFCNTFTKVTFPNSLWVGFLSFIGADSIYKKFEGKLSSHSELRKKK